MLGLLVGGARLRYARVLGSIRPFPARKQGSSVPRAAQKFVPGWKTKKRGSARISGSACHEPCYEGTRYIDAGSLCVRQLANRLDFQISIA